MRSNPIAASDVPEWESGRVDEPLPAGGLRLWLWGLDRAGNTSIPLVSPDELARANRFHFEADRRRFANARAGLRRVLGGALDIAPSEVRFQYDPRGKPRLAEQHSSDLRFNLSHSAGVALLAVSRSAEVGVDIEAIRPSRWTSGIAERYFAPAEIATLQAMPANQQDRAFFGFWTNKEAVVKLLGDGLSFPLPTFATPADAETGANVALPRGNPLGLSSCWLRSLPVGERLRASVCVSRVPRAVELQRADW